MCAVCKTNQNIICCDLNSVDMPFCFICNPGVSMLLLEKVFCFLHSRTSLFLSFRWNMFISKMKNTRTQTQAGRERQGENDNGKSVFELLMNREREIERQRQKKSRNKKHEIWRSDSWIKLNFPCEKNGLVWGAGRKTAPKKNTRNKNIYLWHVTLTHPFLRVFFYFISFYFCSFLVIAKFGIPKQNTTNDRIFLFAHSFNSCDAIIIDVRWRQIDDVT